MTDFARIKKEYADTQVLSTSPFVGFKEGVVTPEECAYIIALANGKTQRATVSLDKESKIIPGRSGSNCWLRYSEDDTVRNIGERISAIVGIPLENAEAMQVIHYGPEQEYRGHYDAYDLTTARGQRCCLNGGQRLVTALVYLNEVEQGGSTRFDKLGVEVQAKQGRLALFHNVDEDYTYPHQDSLHAGTPVISGEKWAFNIWFHARPMAEKQDFSHLTQLASTPQNDKTPAPPPVLATTMPTITGKFNRAAKLFQQAIDQLDPVLIKKAGDICFTYWDTYGNNHPDLSSVTEGARLLQLIDRPTANILSNKATLARSLMTHNLEAIAPKTYFTIEDALNHQGDAVPIWFIKNALGTGGKNMVCVTNDELASVELQKNYIVQAGVTDLALFDGRKFTARAYCFVWNHQIYLYQNGFLIVHGCEYDPESTDYAVQIDHTGYQNANSSVKMHQLINHPEYFDYYPKIKELVQALQPVLEPVRLKADSSHYIMLGIDLLFRNDGSVNLLEINSIPNFIHSNEIINKVNIPFFSAALRTMLGDKTVVLETVISPKKGAL